MTRGVSRPGCPPHGPPKGPPPPRPVNRPPDDADVATRPHHGPKGPPPTGPPPKGPPPKGPPPKGPAPKGPPPKGPPPGTAVNQPDRPPPCPECTGVYDCRRCGRCLAHSAHPIMVRSSRAKTLFGLVMLFWSRCQLPRQNLWEVGG